MADPSLRRLPLRQLLTMAEKCARDMGEHLNSELLTQVADFRDLSRPVRRKSSFPSVRTVRHSLDKLLRIGDELNRLGTALQEQLVEIRERSQRERRSRGT